MRDPALYQAILARQSVRRYERRPLDAETQARVRGAADAARPLDPDIPFEILWRDVDAPQDLAAILGPYGRIVTPPHFLVPAARGGARALVELGYRVEQIAVRLAGMGVGSCYLGSLSREDEMRDQFGLAGDARVAAALIYGSPARGWGGRAINALIHRAAGAANKLPVERFFYTDTLEQPGPALSELAPLLEAARAAPSAVNAQPWRLLWRDGALTLFVQRRNARYGSGPGALYRYHDGGCCMANLSLALAAQRGEDARWELLLGGEAQVPQHPEELEPLARLTLD